MKRNSLMIFLITICFMGFFSFSDTFSPFDKKNDSDLTLLKKNTETHKKDKTSEWSRNSRRVISPTSDVWLAYGTKRSVEEKSMIFG